MRPDFSGAFVLVFAMGVIAGVGLVMVIYGVYELIGHLRWQ